ncbi:putative membrane protein [Synechococcus sp. BIOS-U3-1]|uniref:SxtJ family membrane protein n=1 Tax=Synechococcus sp. BIOS-U3-1 TaxID=1400865 RepID=UPI001647777A|nr:SxtJ family membrane protein [Synechococcus sp. BIOS-U3-1]QNI57041.1 putative membrane protein [Synechococcus sp. BIOS-U3-1]|tara:strand:- start:535 stop:936 length:402 start_codon:yes stop_codon:yes gene_type:complete
MASKPTPKRKQLRQFGLLLGVLIPLFFCVLLPALHSHSAPLWPVGIGVLLILLGVVAPQRLSLVYRGWMALGNVLGFINSHLILGVVFVFVLQPIALIMRCLGHDPLRKRWDASTDSYREVVQGRRTNLKQPF